MSGKVKSIVSGTQRVAVGVLEGCFKERLGKCGFKLKVALQSLLKRSVVTDQLAVIAAAFVFIMWMCGW